MASLLAVAALLVLMFRFAGCRGAISMFDVPVAQVDAAAFLVFRGPCFDTGATIIFPLGGFM